MNLEFKSFYLKGTIHFLYFCCLVILLVTNVILFLSRPTSPSRPEALSFHKKHLWGDDNFRVFIMESPVNFTMVDHFFLNTSECNCDLTIFGANFHQQKQIDNLTLFMTESLHEEGV